MQSLLYALAINVLTLRWGASRLWRWFVSSMILVMVVMLKSLLGSTSRCSVSLQYAVAFWRRSRNFVQTYSAQFAQACEFYVCNARLNGLLGDRARTWS
jgi:hypothetical protein